MMIRRYYGYDCDSVMGFNNGRYVDNDYIEVKDHDEAFQLCKEALAENWDIDPTQLTEEDNGYTLITGHYDDKGNDLTPEEFATLNENAEVGSWRYVYVTYETDE